MVVENGGGGSVRPRRLLWATEFFRLNLNHVSKSYSKAVKSLYSSIILVDNTRR